MLVDLAGFAAGLLLKARQQLFKGDMSGEKKTRSPALEFPSSVFPPTTAAGCTVTLTHTHSPARPAAMYIKRIVIEGFKTYKDRVIIDLDPGMTIIGTLLSPGSFFSCERVRSLSHWPATPIPTRIVANRRAQSRPYPD